jgi:hypothetical protein
MAGRQPAIAVLDPTSTLAAHGLNTARAVLSLNALLGAFDRAKGRVVLDAQPPLSPWPSLSDEPSDEPSDGPSEEPSNAPPDEPSDASPDGRAARGAGAAALLRQPCLLGRLARALVRGAVEGPVHRELLALPR